MKNLTRVTTLALAAWTGLLSSIGLSEPYKISKGDTLSGIAAAHNVTVKQIKAANQNKITNENIIRVGMIIIIPEPPSSIGPPASPNDGPLDSPMPPHALVHKPARESSEISTFRTGLDRGWVVTQNPETNKIFVHTSSSGGMLTGLRYLIKESTRTTDDGTTVTEWTLFRAAHRADGTTTYGQRVGVMNKPPDVGMGSCTCE